MRLSKTHMIGLAFLMGCILTYIMINGIPMTEGFQGEDVPTCPACGTGSPDTSNGGCPPVPDMSQYVLKSSIPPPPSMPDLTNYMLKTECPPVPDMSQYVLKSSIPPQQPVIVDTSQCSKECGECPPCPRPRCPDVKCAPPTVCPAPPPCPRPVCPQTTVKCRAEELDNSPVRPFLAPLNMSGFGLG